MFELFNLNQPNWIALNWSIQKVSIQSESGLLTLQIKLITDKKKGETERERESGVLQKREEKGNDKEPFDKMIVSCCAWSGLNECGGQTGEQIFNNLKRLIKN